MLKTVRSMLGSWPVAVPAFRLLMVGQLTSTLGDYFFAVALPWYVLSRGGSQEAAAMYRAFRGRDPVVDPLLIERGLKAPTEPTSDKK